MKIYRNYQNLRNLAKKGKVLVIYGPRQVGKTTLVENYLNNNRWKVFRSTGEDINLQDVLNSRDLNRIMQYFADYDLIFIDEAQMVQDVGISLKMMADSLKDTYIIVTGSSSFDLSNKIGEPLVGRQKILKLFPISFLELKQEFGSSYLIDNLESLLIFGSYPDIITAKSINAKKEYLLSIRDSYLYKDILILENIKNSKKILDLLRIIAFQIGKEVSLQQIGSVLGISKNTVARYLDLLEKAFVLINIRGFSRNLRKEINKTSRYYFYDLGIRNAIISNFNSIESRNDIGQLWENAMVIERIKKQEYTSLYANNFFWRTWTQAEIDFVEERDGGLYGFEFKWQQKNSVAPKLWLDTYKNAFYSEINNTNFLDFVT